MEVNSMHSAIEYAQKHVLVVIMRDWMNIFKITRSNRNRNADKYACQEWKFDDLKNLKKLPAYLIQNRIRDSMNRKVQWLKIKRMRYEKEKPNIIFFSYDQDSEYRELHVRSRGRPVKPAIENLFKKAIEISERKKKEQKKYILKLCSTKVIPEAYHHWYRSLPSSKNKTVRVPEPQIDSESEEEFE
jgi:predicted RNA binding protein with dsRBD fold (UPF0201 family)